MAIEGVQGHSTKDSIAQGGHLLQLIASSRLATRAIPRSPFVDNQLDPVLRIFLAHNLPVAVDKPLHAVSFAHEFVPVHGLKIDGVALALDPVLCLPAAEIPSIVMKRPPVDGAQFPSSLVHDFLKETSGPRPVIAQIG